MVSASTTQVKSVKDKSAISTGQCYSYDSAEAKRSLLESAYNSNQSAFSTLSNIITQSQSNYTNNINGLKQATSDFSVIYNNV